MSEQVPSKEKLPDWLRRWYALKGELRFREAADEIERLQVIEKLYNEQCDAGYARGSALEPTAPASKELIAAWITREVGERCQNHSPSCMLCLIWEYFDQTQQWPSPKPRTYADTAGTYADSAHEPAAPASKDLSMALLREWHLADERFDLEDWSRRVRNFVEDAPQFFTDTEGAIDFQPVATPEPPDSLWGDGTREMLIELRDWLRSKMPCPAGDCCNQLRDWIEKVDKHISFHAPRAAQPPPAGCAQCSNVAPIAKLTVRDGLAVRAGLYAPGLPDGEHDVYPVASSQPPAAVENTRVQFIAEAAKRDDTDFRTNAPFYVRDLLLHIHGMIRERKPSQPPSEYPEELFDGCAVERELTGQARRRTSTENVIDVLDAVVRLMKKRRARPTKGDSQ